MTEMLGFGLVSLALLGGAAEADSTNRVDALLQQAAQLAPADQQHFLVWIEARLNRANAMVLSRKEAAAARAALHAKVRRETVPRSQLRRLLRELDRREKQAIEQLTRQYRLLHTIRVFRNARDTDDQRLKAWFDVHAAWEAAGRPLAQQHKVLDWLTTAIEFSIGGKTAALPRAPRFETASLGALLPGVPGRATSPKSATPDAVASGPPGYAPSPSLAEEPPPSPAPPLQASSPAVAVTAEYLRPPAVTIHKRVAAFAPSSDGRKFMIAECVDPETNNSGPALEPITSSPSGRTLREPQLAGSGTVSDPRETMPLCALPVPEAAPQPVPATSPPMPSLAKPVARRGPSERPSANGQTLPERPTLPMPEWSAASGISETARSGRPKTPLQSEIALAGIDRRTRRLSEPLLAQSAVGVVLPCNASDGILLEDPPSNKQTVPSHRSEAKPELSFVCAPANATGDTQQSRPTVGVNVGELRARIAGTNMALRALEAVLYEPRSWRPDELAPMMARLHALALRVEDLRLFREMVPEETRGLIDAVDSPQSAITLAAARIAEARERISDGRYPGTEIERHADLSRLNDLSRRLAEIADTLGR